MSEPKKREMFKTITIDDIDFRIKRFNPFDGSYYVFLLLQQALPSMISGLLGNSGIRAVPGSALMDKKTFGELQMDCLKLCEANLPAGWIDIIQPNGTFALPALEGNTRIVMALTVHALIWSFADFFGESGLSTWIGLFPGLLPFIKTLMVGNIPPSSPDSGDSANSGTEPTIS